MLNKILSLSKNLIRIRSTEDNSSGLKQALKLVLLNLKGFNIEHFEKDGVKSALVYNTSKRPKKFKLLLNGHLDVVPGKEYQYKPKVKNKKLYGVGALDMKSNLACLVLVFKEIAKKVDYPLGLQLVTDEEVGGFKGTKLQIDKGVRADFVIAGETTNFNIANKAKGILWLKISSIGKTAHGAYPWKGENAIWKMNKFIELIEKHYPTITKEAWKTTINLSKIETTNQSFNKIPDDCTISLDIRYIPEDKNKIIDNFKKLMPKNFKLEVLLNEPSMFVEEENKYISRLKIIAERIVKRKILTYGANGSSDARHYSRVKGNGIEFGPIGGGIGTDNEWINISSLEKYYSVLKEFLLSLNKNPIHKPS